jgi:nicotinate-nucleotide adenylyltransferase
MRSRRVGYFGGTFDPPHLGHMILALEAQYQLKLDSLQFILTPVPPHKNEREVSPPEARLEMLSLAIEGQRGFIISRVDLDRNPPHYAADTVELIKAEHPEEELIYIIGEDSLRDLIDWVEPERFLHSVDQLAVAPRPGVVLDIETLEKPLAGLREKTVWLTDVMVEISSSRIRERIRAGAPYRHFLPETVALYLDGHQLYQ